MFIETRQSRKGKQVDEETQTAIVSFLNARLVYQNYVAKNSIDGFCC